jgi:cytochrome c553
MNKIVKRVGLGLGGILLLAVGAGAAGFLIGNSRLTATHEGVGHDLEIPTDSASIATGRRLTSAYGCTDCHAEDLGGKMLVESAAFAMMPAPNLTSGEGGVGGSYTVTDWERAIRHGVAPDGRTLFIMPSGSYAKFADRDIAEIIAYVQTVPPVDRSFPQRSFGPMSRVAALMAASEIVPATTLDHEAPHPPALPRAATLEYGQYLAAACTGCHGADYSGMPAGMGSDLPAANLTPHEATGLGSWSDEDFHTALTTGVRPDGRVLDPELMPWRALASLTEVEVQAIWMFLQSLPAVEADRSVEGS